MLLKYISDKYFDKYDICKDKICNRLDYGNEIRKFDNNY